MTTETVTLKVDNSQALRGINDVTKSVDGLNGKFAKLVTAANGFALAATAAFTAVLPSLLNYAARLQDISDSTGIATANILGFAGAVQQSGGDFEKAQTGVLKLVEGIGEARNGSKSAIEAFKRVGVTLGDLKTLSESAILTKTINGLASIEDASKRAAAQTDLLGKALRGVDITNVQKVFGVSVRESAKYSESIKTAAAAEDAMAKNLNNLYIALLKVLTPLTEAISKLNITVDAFSALIKAIIAAASAFLIFTRVIPVLDNVSTKIFKLITEGGLLRVTFKKLGDVLKYPLEVIGTLIKVFTSSAGIFTKLGAALMVFLRFIGRFLGWVGIIYSAVEALKFLNEAFFKSEGIKSYTDKWDALVNKVLEYIGLTDKIEGIPVIGVGAGQAAPEGFTSLKEYFEIERQRRKDAAEAKSQDEAKQRSEAAKRAAEQLQTRMDNLRDSIAKVAVEYEKYSNNLRKGYNQQIANLSLSQDEIRLNEAILEVRNRAAESISEYNSMLANLKADEKGLIPIIEAQKEAIKKRAAEDEASVSRSVTALQHYEQMGREIATEFENLAQSQREAFEISQIEDQLKLIGLYGVALEDQQAILEVTTQLKEKLLDLEVRQNDIILNRVKLGEEEFQRQMANLETLRQRAYEYANARIDAEQRVREAQRKTSEDWLSALGQQMEDLAKEITPAAMAVNMFESVVSSIDDALTQFVEKGKFNFKDFTQSILRDMAVIIARALVMRAVLGVLGVIFPGSATGISALLNAAPRRAGGPVSGSSPYIVGEAGPELFVPRTAGTIVPNNQLAMAGGGSTNVTYNINAVDASSFRSLVARDPQFIYNVTEVGRRSNPARRLA